MVSEQATRKVVKAFRDAGWRRVRTEGSHSVYECRCGQHVFTLPDGHTTISPGVVRKADKARAACDEEGR